MNTIPKELHLEILQYCKVKYFIKFSFLNKYYLELCKEYLKIKKKQFEKKNIEKTYKNCLYKIQLEPFQIAENNRDKQNNNSIIKIVKICDDTKKPGKKKITFWVITKLGKIGTGNNIKLSIYPNWCSVREIDKSKFIPFY